MRTFEGGENWRKRILNPLNRGERNIKGENLGILYRNVCQIEKGAKIKGGEICDFWPKGPVKIYRVPPRPGFGKNLPEKKSSPPFF